MNIGYIRAMSDEAIAGLTVNDLERLIAYDATGAPYATYGTRWENLIRDKIECLEARCQVAIAGSVSVQGRYVDFRITGLGRRASTWAKIRWA